MISAVPKRLRLLAALTALLVTALALILFLPRQPRITETNLNRVRPGMTRPEVEAILGGPPGFYAGGPTLLLPDECHRVISDEIVPDSMLERWWGDDGALSVTFNPSGRVIGSQWCRCKRIELGLVGWLRWRFAVEWERCFPRQSGISRPTTDDA
jgi:hypothetical protein